MSSADDCNQMVDCILNIPPSPHFCCSNTFKTSDLADVMQLEEVGSKFASYEAKSCEEENGIDEDRTKLNLAVETVGKSPAVKAKNKRKRARATKTNEEVERQRMTHIAVERNRRKQMNEHLQILRSLMPTSYVHRGDQASIVGGAIEFVRELEHLLQCLESVKRRQLYGDEHGLEQQKQCHQEPLMLPAMPVDADDQEETAESKSCLADVEVKLSGSFGLIKILSERRPGQLIKYIAALEHLQLHILQTNVTTIELNIVCSFSVKISGEARFTAEDIANSIQQILTSVHDNSSSSSIMS